MTRLNNITELREIMNQFSLLQICLYSSDFQIKLSKMDKQKQKQVDRLIKEYIGKIRKGRDCQYAKGKLPEAAKVEISNFRPML